MDERFPSTYLIVEALSGTACVVPLSRDETAHARARRLTPGDRVTLIDGSGGRARGRLLPWTRRGAEVAVEDFDPFEQVESARETGAGIDLVVAAVRAERLSWLVEKATELAVERVVVVSTQRTQSFRASGSTRDRLTRVAREAAKQSQRARWPSIEGPIALEKALSAEPTGERLVLDFDGGRFPASLSPPVRILVGPEGGWSPAEQVAFRQTGWTPVALPAGKLRCETAAIAALVLARAALAPGK